MFFTDPEDRFEIEVWLDSKKPDIIMFRNKKDTNQYGYSRIKTKEHYFEEWYLSPEHNENSKNFAPKRSRTKYYGVGWDGFFLHKPTKRTKVQKSFQYFGTYKDLVEFVAEHGKWSLPLTTQKGDLVLVPTTDNGTNIYLNQDDNRRIADDFFEFYINENNEKKMKINPKYDKEKISQTLKETYEEGYVRTYNNAYCGGAIEGNFHTHPFWVYEDILNVMEANNRETPKYHSVKALVVSSNKDNETERSLTYVDRMLLVNNEDLWNYAKARALTPPQ